MKNKLLIALAGLAIMAVAIAAVPAFQFEDRNGGVQVGDAAIGFKLKNIDGKMVSMADYPKAKGFILTFTCNHCPYSKMYEQRIIDLHKKYEKLGYPVIAINPNDPTAYPEDSFEQMQARAQEKGYGFPYLVDETQDIARAYGATKTPHVYVLEQQRGEIKVRYIGAIDNAPQDGSQAGERYVEEAVDALLAGKPVSKTVTKAIGCSIKWKQ
jgi:peroxiredoxin